MDTPPDGRSPFALAYEWASRIIAIGLMMVLPIVVGNRIDLWLGTKMIFTILGLVLGGAFFIVGMWHLLRLTK